jgi:TPP-dependent pyruvate/acetoin dehydrogenase alpha subunit
MLSSDQAIEFYRQMLLIRRFEETAMELFKKGVLNGTVHTCIGQECCSVGVINALNRQRDVVFSNHRGHGHFLALNDNLEGLMAELMGRATGVCGGIGGSQHLHQGNFYSNGIQGGIVPVATGMALAEKHLRTGAMCVVFLGDGTMGEGVVYESFNLAATWQIPILFVIENNRYAQTTPVELTHCGALANRPRAFGIETICASGFDVEEVYARATELVQRVRSGQPGCLHLDTYRLAAHSKGDDTRDPAEIAAYWQKDPLKAFGASVSATARDAVQRQVETRMQEAVASCLQGKSQDFARYRERMGDREFART